MDINTTEHTAQMTLDRQSMNMIRDLDITTNEDDNRYQWKSYFEPRMAEILWNRLIWWMLLQLKPSINKWRIGDGSNMTNEE